MKRNALKNKKGTVFIITIILSALSAALAYYVANIIYQDTYLMRHLKDSLAAEYLAEAGINDAISVLIQNGFSAKDNPLNFPLKSLGEGTYDASVFESGGRVLLKSVGTVRNVSKTVSCEVRDLTPTSLFYMMSAGNNLRVRSIGTPWDFSTVDIDGNMHSNQNLHLSKGPRSSFDVNEEGNLSATNIVTLTPAGDPPIYHGTLTNGAPMVTFPVFDYNHYKSVAGASYYSGDKSFGGIFQTTNITPANGIVYVEGTATFWGTCNLYGGIVADEIVVYGTLNQFKTALNRNVVISRTGDIRVFVSFDAEEAIVYSGRDFVTVSSGSLEVKGAIIAARDMWIWDFATDVYYDHELLYPDGLVISESGIALEVLNWTR